MSLIDSHAHLDDERFDEDREQVIANAVDAGITSLINVGHDMESSERSIALADKYPFIYAAVGVHPHDAKDAPDGYIDRLKDLLKNQKVVAVGEIGLDYYYDLSPRDVQQKVFIEQLNLAKEAARPVIIHLRDAYGDFLDIMRRERLEPAAGVMHCFSGSWEVARECLEMGFYISFAGPVTFKNAAKLRETAQKIPLEKILVETDCPYLTPVPHRGKRNEPAYVRLVAEQIAAVKGLSTEEFCRHTVENAKKLFGIDGGETAEGETAV